MMGMLDAGDLELAGLMKNVRLLATNSGGSWFLSQMAYSEKFVTQVLQAGDEGASYKGNGYLGAVKTVYDATTKTESCADAIAKQLFSDWILDHLSEELLKVVCDYFGKVGYSVDLLGLTNDDTANGAVWINFVEDFVYAPLDMLNELEGVTMGDTPQTWARSKGITFATGALSKGVVLASSDRDVHGEKNMYTLDPTWAWRHR